MTLARPETLAVAAIVDAPRNANRMDDVRWVKLREAIKADGFLQPVLVRELAGGKYEIVDGHHRTRAARELGLSHLPAIVFDASVKNAEAARIAIAMNRLRGELRLGEVAEIFAQLLDDGMEVEQLIATGFSADEVDALISAANDTGEEISASMTAVEPRDDDEVIKPWLLEVPFGSKSDLDKVKRAVKRAAGKGGDLALGLLRLCGEET